jgi:hypothetical protein
MLINIVSVGWRSVTMTQTATPTSYGRVASWGAMEADGTWHHACINVRDQLQASRACFPVSLLVFLV